MPIRLRAFLLIIAIAAAIAVTTMGTSLFFISRSLEKTVEDSITVMSEIADELVSSQINLLKARADAAAQHLLGAPEDQWPLILREQADEYERCLGMTVLDRNGIVLAYGEAPTPADLLNSKYMRRALAGEMVISTTRKDPSGQLVFHVCVPMEGRVLSVTIPGLYFRDLLAPYTIWDSGSVYILDEEGTVIAYKRTSMVLNRHNAIELAKTGQETQSSADFTRRMIQGGKGAGSYILFGLERIAVYTAVTGSNVGWVLGVSAPLSESPAAKVDKGLMLAVLAFLGLGAIAAFFASGHIAKPFLIINEQNLRFAELSEAAHKASKAKSHFLANMSHEMRTPLNAVIGFSELMLHGNAEPEEKKGNLEKIHTAGMILLGIVNDILDISKIESGKLEIIPVNYDIASLINGTVTVNLVRIGEKRIEFNLHIDKNLPSRLIGDELRIKQVCSNLLSNAFKYTREGRVDMRVSGEKDGGCVWLTISVEDTGIGIRPEDMAKLFSDYNQVDTKSNREIEGTGLGLSITRKLVEMMDGRIAVESEYGRGSTFTVVVRQQFVTDVPLGEEVANNLESFDYLRQKNARIAERGITPLPHARVLIVDDVQTNLDVARGMLKPYGMRVDCVTDGRQAIDLIRRETVRYDAIFMDHMMPGMDGIETARLIREIGTEYAGTVPIIALTANAIVGNEQMFLRHGFQAFLSKPVDIQRMDMVLKRWVRNRTPGEEIPESREETAAPEEAADTAGPSFPERLRIDGLDLKKCLERFGGDGDALLRTLRAFATNTPALLDRMRAPAEESLPEYTIVAHGIKSSGYGICAMSVGKGAEELERAAQAGDFGFVRENNGAFVEAVEKLIADLSAMLDGCNAESRKPQKAEPDAATLDRLREACANYDMDGVDKAMAELESFAYDRRPELVAWLRERVDMMDFGQILDRLSA
ncbi:MAG: response regulator [Desulfovibrio sp.]|jgi:signal transduction histidine kinase/CheY-like chemotaxis protein|nr:response regulator [Desulfovibrio sp.]